MLRFSHPACRAVQRALWDYANHRLSEELLERVERHLPDCAECQSELASLRRAQSLLHACRQQEIPPPCSDWETLRQRLIEEGHVFTRPGFAATHTIEARVAVAAAPSRRRNRPPTGSGGGWLPSMMWSSVIAILLLCAAFGYRVQAHARTVAPKPSITPNRANLSAESPSVPGTTDRPQAVSSQEESSVRWPNYIVVPASSERNAERLSSTPTNADSQMPGRFPGMAHPDFALAWAALALENAACGAQTASSAVVSEPKQAKSSHLRFVPHKPRPEEAAGQPARDPHLAPLDQIAPGSNGDTFHRFVMEPLTPVRYEDNTAY
jgi:hypothetical protein